MAVSFCITLIVVGEALWYGLRAYEMGLSPLLWSLGGGSLCLVIYLIVTAFVGMVISPDSIYAVFHFLLTASLTPVVTGGVGGYFFREATCLPEIVACPACGSEMELDRAERAARRFRCADCKQDVDVSALQRESRFHDPFAV